jgi:oligopeptide transport system substrate-binding protein
VVTKVVEKVATPTPVARNGPVTLHWNLGTEPPEVDPALATDTTSVNVDELLFLGLTDSDDLTGEVVPELAMSWSVSNDGLVWTFDMRDDVPWIRYTPATGETTVLRMVSDGHGPGRRVRGQTNSRP